MISTLRRHAQALATRALTAVEPYVLPHLPTVQAMSARINQLRDDADEMRDQLNNARVLRSDVANLMAERDGLEAQLAEVAAERNALRVQVEADGAELTPRLCAGCDDRNRIAQTLAQVLAERDQVQRDLREAQELVPLARNERRVTVSDQLRPRCGCKPLQDRGLWRTWTAVGLWSARLPAQELLVTCRRCRASWVWGRR